MSNETLPTLSQIEAAIETAELWTEDSRFIPDTSGICFEVGKLKALTFAAKMAVELVDFETATLKAFIREKPKRRKKKPGHFTGSPVS